MILFRKRHEGITRAVTVGIAVLLQVVVTYVLASLLEGYLPWFYIVFQISSILLVFGLVNDGQTYKYFWIVIVLVLPVFGLFLYFYIAFCRIAAHRGSDVTRRLQLQSIKTRCRTFLLIRTTLLFQWDTRHLWN